MTESLYHTEIINDEGLNGTAYVKDGIAVVTSDPFANTPGTNPEQLFGLSWATCLNATVAALLKGRDMEAKCKVEVHVDYHREESGRGYYFDLKAIIAIEGLELELAEKIAQSAHKRCPVSKIIGSYEHVSIAVVPYVA